MTEGLSQEAGEPRPGDGADHRVTPRSLRIDANGLRHHVLEWEGEGEAASTRLAGRTPPLTVLLIHGFMDAAGTWDRVAPKVASEGHRVLAPDMRGFGRSDRAPRGSYYHFSDYVADLAELVVALAPKTPVAVVGHSMGGTIATLYASAFPENVVRLASLEGLGPPNHGVEAGPIRMRSWIEEVRATAARGEPKALPPDEALRRLVLNHPAIPRDVLATRLPHLVEADDAEGMVRWRYDPRHRTTSPVPFLTDLFVAFARRVSAPVLFVSGGPTGFHPPDEEARLAAFSRLVRVTLEDAGHMMHWTRPDALAAQLVTFLR